MEEIHVQRGKMTVVQAPPSSGKTRALLEVAHKTARDGLIVHYYCCDSDVASTLRVRDHFEIAPSDLVKFKVGKTTPGFVTEVIEECKKSHPDAVILDGLPMTVNRMRLLSVAARELNIAFIPSGDMNKVPKGRLGTA